MNFDEKIDIAQLKKMTKQKRLEKVTEFEEQKAVLIERYMELQDILDEYNEQIYTISCRIELLNLAVRELSPRARKKLKARISK